MDVFVYGTLTDPERVAAVVDSFAFVGGAVLHGLHAVQGTYPTLAPGGEVGGRLLRTRDLEALDAYEGVDGGPYVRVSVPATGQYHAETVEVYVGDPDALGATACWPGEGSFEDRVRQYLRRGTVRVDPR
jgi:gamma-glutamylcyclotransferase (GGCT)/AIG2-like uncharacterized protein YtfP